MTNVEKQSLVSNAKGLAKWFSISITIKVLGVTILSVEFPPKDS